MPNRELTLESLGWSPRLEATFKACREKGLEPGRVAVEDKHHYLLITSQGELTGQTAGKLLHQAASPAELPKVGDWVAVAPLPNEHKAVIHQILPRSTRLSRKVPGREVEEQVLVTNVDLVFIVQGLDRPFNRGLLQRHLIMVRESGARPVLLLNKADLCEDLDRQLSQARQAAADAAVLAVSARTGQDLENLARCIRPGQTAVFIGASGVGKSSLINQLYGEEILPTADVRESDAKGRHTTTWRELIPLPNGGLVIDTPGMREFQMWIADEGVHEAFPDIEELAVRCHFRDCSHTVEKRCAVLEAVAGGRLTSERYQSYLKLTKELEYLEQARTTHAYLERKRRTKAAQRAFDKIKRQPGRSGA